MCCMWDSLGQGGGSDFVLCVGQLVLGFGE